MRSGPHTGLVYYIDGFAFCQEIILNFFKKFQIFFVGDGAYNIPSAVRRHWNARGVEGAAPYTGIFLLDDQVDQLVLAQTGFLLNGIP